MRLRWQALLLSTVLLGPLAALNQYLRADTQALDALHQRTLSQQAKAIAATLSQQPQWLYPTRDRQSQAQAEPGLWVDRSQREPVLDGSFDDWLGAHWQRFGSNRFPLKIALAQSSDRLYLAIDIADARSHRQPLQRAANVNNPVGDRLVLRREHNGFVEDLGIDSAAPGPVIARVLQHRKRPLQNLGLRPEVQGWWAESDAGYQVELQLPLSSAGMRLGLAYVDSDEGGFTVRGNIDLSTRSPAPRLIMPSEILHERLVQLQRDEVALQVFDRWGWPLAAALPSNANADASWRHILSSTEHDSFTLLPGDAAITQRVAHNASEPHTNAYFRAPDMTLGTQLLRWLRKPTDASSPQPLTENSQASSTWLGLLRTGDTTKQRLNLAGVEVLEIATTLRANGQIIGFLRALEPSESFAKAHDRATGQLLLQTVLSVMLALFALLGFTILTGWRLRRLTHQVSPDGLANPAQLPQLPESFLRDEIDQLAKQLNALLREQHRLQQYLRAMPKALAHEIRTPVAVIRTSLERLAQDVHSPRNPPRATASDAEPKHGDVIARAEGGLQRLVAVLDAMNEANRLEATVQSETKQAINLADLMAQMRDAYQQTFPDWQFSLKTRLVEAPATLAPELIVQALDKLVANACSFSRRGSVIVLSLEQRGLWWRVSVSNTGPLLPEDNAALFAPMMSARQTSGTDGTDSSGRHLGLGLYIVALVAAHHGGEPYARNRDDGSGVIVGFTVRG